MEDIQVLRTVAWSILDIPMDRWVPLLNGHR